VAPDDVEVQPDSHVEPCPPGVNPEQDYSVTGVHTGGVHIIGLGERREEIESNMSKVTNKDFGRSTSVISAPPVSDLSKLVLAGETTDNTNSQRRSSDGTTTFKSDLSRLRMHSGGGGWGPAAFMADVKKVRMHSGAGTDSLEADHGRVRMSSGGSTDTFEVDLGRVRQSLNCFSIESVDSVGGESSLGSPLPSTPQCSTSGLPLSSSIYQEVPPQLSYDFGYPQHPSSGATYPERTDVSSSTPSATKSNVGLVSGDGSGIRNKVGGFPNEEPSIYDRYKVETSDDEDSSSEASVNVSPFNSLSIASSIAITTDPSPSCLLPDKIPSNMDYVERQTNAVNFNTQRLPTQSSGMLPSNRHVSENTKKLDSIRDSLSRPRDHVTTDPGLSPRPAAVDSDAFKKRPHNRLLSYERRTKFDTAHAGSSKRNRTLSSTFGELDLADTVAPLVETEVRKSACLPENCVRQWAAEIIVAVGRLHALGIICR